MLPRLTNAIKQDKISEKLEIYLESHGDQHYLPFLKAALNHHYFLPFDIDKLREYAPDLLPIRQNEFQQIQRELNKQAIKINGMDFTKEEAHAWQDFLNKLPHLQEIESQTRRFLLEFDDEISQFDEHDLQYLINMMRQDYIHNMVINLQGQADLSHQEIKFLRTVATHTFPKTPAEQDCAHLFKKDIVNEMINLGDNRAIAQLLKEKIQAFEERPDYLLLPLEDRYQKIIDLKHYLLRDLAEKKPSHQRETEKIIHSSFGKFAHQRFEELSTRIKSKNKDVYNVLMFKKSLNNKNYHFISDKLDPLYKKLGKISEDKEGVVKTLCDFKRKIEAYERQYNNDDGINKAIISTEIKKILAERKHFIDTHQKTIKEYEKIIFSLYTTNKLIHKNLHENNPQWVKAKNKLEFQIDYFQAKLDDPSIDENKKSKAHEQIQLLKLEHEDVKQIKGMIEERKHEVEIKIHKLRDLTSTRHTEDDDIINLREKLNAVITLGNGESVTQVALADVKIENLLHQFAKNNPLGVMQRVEIEKIVEELKREPSLKNKRKKLNKFIRFAKNRENRSILAKHHSKLIVGYIKQLLRINSDSINALEKLKEDIKQIEATNKLGMQSLFFRPQNAKSGISSRDSDQEGFIRN